MNNPDQLDPSFEHLVTSRKAWIESVLRPWCQVACRKDLLKAEMEWVDIAGKARVEATLWTWAWERFPAMVYEGLTGVNETREVIVEFKDGTTKRGFPDGRRSERGQLVLLINENEEQASASDLVETEPFSLDDIISVEAVS